MKASDYIVSFLIEKEITDVFGYPGGMVTHLMDSFDKYKEAIKSHVNYHEQASAFAACGYAQVSHKMGVAYATSGPGATNLITGIANAYFDSIPCMFLTGQVNTYEARGKLPLRQKGFQETDIVEIVKSITKYAVKIEKAEELPYELEKAYTLCMEGRPGPVLLDIPMNVQRENIEPDTCKVFRPNKHKTIDRIENVKQLERLLHNAEKPVILAGGGINTSGCAAKFRALAETMNIPVVTTMLARDVLPESCAYHFGFVGAYGHRYANFIISHSDLIISIGSRMDSRQTGVNLDLFAPGAKLVRFDVDEGELQNQVKRDELHIVGNLRETLSILGAFRYQKRDKWFSVCEKIKTLLYNIDIQQETNRMSELSVIIPNNSTITTDVGQNQVWAAQALYLKENQRMLFTGGHGSMGYSLPAAIGAYYASGRPVISLNGDGGFQMNMQELEFIAREQLPIKIVLFNNHSLGMIRHFQEMYFNSNFVQTKAEHGYTVPKFCMISKAYGIPYIYISDKDELIEIKKVMENRKPCLIEIALCDTTYVMPKLSMGKPIYDQDPLMERSLLEELTKLCEI